MKQTTLYIVASKNQQLKNGVVQSLKRAAEASGITSHLLIVEDTVLDTIADMQFEQGSLLYRVSVSRKAAIMESMLMLLHPGIFTAIYIPALLQLPSQQYRELCEQMAQGLQIIPTLIIDETWQQLDIQSLDKRIAKMGGFPIVVKMLGLSHGAGVRKVDNLDDLQAILMQLPPEKYGSIVRKYLADYRHYRLIVIEDSVVAALEYHKPVDDFRTNATGEPIISAVSVEELQDEVVRLALDGVRLRSSILGGVDILIDQTDNMAYLAEVNVPCNYARAEGPTNIDISRQLLDAMLRKRDRHNLYE